MILEAHQLGKSFDGFVAVRDVSLSIEQGKCLALLGPNGAGKTTTIEMLTGLTEPDRGTVRLFGKGYADSRAYILGKVGVVLQETNLYKKLTVRETLELFRSFYSDGLEVQDVIARLQLGEKAGVRLEKLSGGQKQRVYLGCALINQPELLFLDEPTTGLDPQSRRLLWEFLLEEKARGMSILLTTHYMEEAEFLANEVSVMDHGEIIASGGPRALITQFCGGSVLDFSFDHATSEPERSRFLSANSWLGEARLNAERVELLTETPVESITKLTRAASDEGIDLAAIEIRKSTLEDVFLKLTGRSIRDV